VIWPGRQCDPVSQGQKSRPGTIWLGGLGCGRRLGGVVFGGGVFGARGLIEGCSAKRVGWQVQKRGGLELGSLLNEA
jgi:hypothetical protein